MMLLPKLLLGDGTVSSSSASHGAVSKHAMSINIRSLKGIDYDVMAEAFNDAFSDYAVPARYTTEYLRDLVLRRGYRPDLAVGAFDKKRLVGFVFNCLDGDEAYNSGTGVVISHRRRGIARYLMEKSIAKLP